MVAIEKQNTVRFLNFLIVDFVTTCAFSLFKTIRAFAAIRACVMCFCCQIKTTTSTVGAEMALATQFDFERT